MQLGCLESVKNPRNEWKNRKCKVSKNNKNGLSFGGLVPRTRPVQGCCELRPVPRYISNTPTCTPWQSDNSCSAASQQETSHPWGRLPLQAPCSDPSHRGRGRHSGCCKNVGSQTFWPTTFGYNWESCKNARNANTL